MIREAENPRKWNNVGTFIKDADEEQNNADGYERPRIESKYEPPLPFELPLLAGRQSKLNCVITGSFAPTALKNCILRLRR